ncbi:MAG: amidophosphoribosyltransferase [Lachnospiraceae bacterium]|nr:amidophosphoribosyltransferase [Lachnospiraceae bacterium]
MSGFFGVAAKEDCVFDLFYGTDYHSHLGTKRAGMAVYDAERGFDRAIHNIENTNFRPKFEGDAKRMKGCLGIGYISDFEPQPLIVRAHHGTYAIATVGKINNDEELVRMLFQDGHAHFMEMSGGGVNPTELTSVLINRCDSIAEGIRYAQEQIRGSMTMLVMTQDAVYAARDPHGRTPVVIGKREGAYCACFESFSFFNLGYTEERELGPGEIVKLTPEGAETVLPAKEEAQLKICTFLWIYYGFPASSYEGRNVETVRNRCGALQAKRDLAKGMPEVDSVAGVPDSGVAHAIGYATASGIPFQRPFVKYTHTWPRSFMPSLQEKRDLIAKMKMIPVHELIREKRLLMIDDSIVRGTQLKETTRFLYENGAKEVHIRTACPPLLYSCPYLNFSRSSSEMELISRRIIERLEGRKTASEELLSDYADPDSARYETMVKEIGKEMEFTSLSYNRLDDMIEAVGLSPCHLCTHCWNGH